jgi:simple sugar transport system permease protein
MKKRDRLFWLQLATPIIAIGVAFLIGAVIILLTGKNPFLVYWTMFAFSFGQLDSIGIILYRATPYIFTGLAVAIGFQLGLFNIGAEGQYKMGLLAAAVVGYSLTGLPAVIHVPLTILAGICGGMLWGVLPIWLRLKRGVHEVISSIMFNYIAGSLLHYLLTGPLLHTNQVGVSQRIMRTPFVLPTAHVPTLHGLFRLIGINMPQYVHANWMLILGIALCALTYWLIWRTPFGYELRAVSGNAIAARASGINAQRMAFVTFLLSAGIAGMAGLSEMLSQTGYMSVDFPSGYGLTGIAIALIARNNPFGIIFSALLFGFLERGAQGIQVLAGVPSEVVTILQGVIILSIVIAYSILGRYVRIQKKKEAA